MAVPGVERRSSGWSIEGAAIAFGAGLVCGALVSVLAFLLARYGPAGDGWSFRGNGALAAYSLIPALLAGGWTAVVLRHRGRPWAGLAAAAAGVGLALALFDSVLLPVFGTGADQTLGPVVLLALVAWSVIAPVGAMLVSRGGAAAAPASIATSVTCAIAWPVGVAAGLYLIGVAFPAGS